MSSKRPHQADADDAQQRIPALERAMAADPSSEVFVELAQALLNSRDPRRATMVLRAGLKAHADHVEGRLLLAEALLGRGKTKTATREMARLLSRHPTEVRAMKLLARCLIRQRQFVEAQVILDRARKTAPTDAEITALHDRVLAERRGRELPPAADEIVIKEPDGQITGIGDKPKPPRAAFTGYIKSVAAGSQPPAPAPDPATAENDVVDDEPTGVAEYTGEDPTGVMDRVPGEDLTGVMDQAPGDEPTGILDRPPAPQLDDTAQLDEAVQAAIAARAQAHEALDDTASLTGITAERRKPFGRRTTTANHDDDDDELTRPMSAPPEGMLAVASVRLPKDPVDPPGGGMRSAVRVVPTHEAPTPEQDALPDQSEDEESTLVGTDLLHATAELVGADDDAPAGAQETSQSAYLNPTMQLPSVAAQALGVSGDRRGVPPDRKTAPRRTVTRDVSARRDSFFGDEPTEALPAQGGADGTPMVDEEDPDVISSARPIDVDQSTVSAVRRSLNDADPEAGPGTVQLPKVKGASRTRKKPRRPDPARKSPPGRPPSAPPKRAGARPAPKAPRKRPPPPPGSKAPKPVDLLDIPLDPGEFRGMPPKPAPGPRAMPDDLNTGQNPAVKGAQAKRPVQQAGPPPAPRGPIPSKRPSAAPRGPIPSKRPSAAPRGPIPSKRPSVAPKGPVPSKRPPPAPAPSRRPAPAPKPADPPPSYEGDFSSYFDGRPVSNLTDHLAAIVDDQRGAADPAAPNRPRPGARRPRRVLGLVAIVAALLILGATVSAWRYRSEARALSQTNDTLRRRLSTGSYGAYRDVAEALHTEGADAVGPLAALADGALRLAGRPGLREVRAGRLALLARVEAERVALFGDRDRLDEAKGLVARARAQAADQPDTRVAEAWLQFADGSTPDVALAALEAATDTAALAFTRAWLNHTAGRDDKALDFVRRAIHLDDRSVLARKLLADLKAERGENSAALEEYGDILARLAPDHVDTRIAQARLRIAVNKRAGEAVTDLKGLVAQADSLKLSPRQLAAAHDSLGRYHARQGDVGSARDAYRRAMEAAPDDPRFSTGLARLDLDEFKLDQAEAVLRKAADADPRSAAFRGLLARARMLRGDAAGALRELSAVTRLDAEAALLKGRALLALEKPREAEAAFEQALRLDASLLDARLYRQLAAFLQGRQRRIILEDLRALRGKPPVGDQRLVDRALPFRAFADALAAERRRDEADDEYRRAIDVDPTDALAHTGRCRLAAAALAAREALGHCRKALAINPHHEPTARLAAEIGEAYLDHGAVVAALKPVVAALEPADRRRLARAYLAVGDLKRARALADGDGVDDATRRAIRGAVALTEGKLRAAEQALAPVTEQLPRDAWAQLQYGQLLLQMGSASKATAYFRRAKALTRDPRPALGAAWAALRQGDRATALAEAREAEKLASKGLTHPRLRAEALASQGHALLTSGRRGQRKAARLFGKALRVEPDLPLALMGQGQLAEAQGQIKDAVARYFRVTQVAPRDAEAHYRLGNLLVGTEAGAARGRADLQRAARLDPEGEWGARATKRLQP